MKMISLVLVAGLLVAGCYHNPRTWVERSGHRAYEYHENGHGWTEKGVVSMQECDWMDIEKADDGMQYCPPKRRGTETAVARVIDSTFDTVVPAAIHGLAFIAAFGVGAALMPATQVSQTVVGGTQNIRTSTLLLNGPVPGGVAR